MKGFFITLEGGDGSGKSTQIERLKAYLEGKGYSVLLTREPGGTKISEAIRQIILDKDYMEMTDMTEALLYAAARAQHVSQLIKPSIETGKIVICDRFVDSSIVYQGHARGIGIEKIAKINEFATEGLEPDLTILLDISAEDGLSRKKSQKELDRLEMQKLQFHQMVTEGYRNLASKNPERILTVDATLPIDQIEMIIRERIDKLLSSKNV